MDSRESNYLLVKFDVSGIQEYIFATNRLRENAGASYQVTRILEEILVEAFQEAAAQEKVSVLTEWKQAGKLMMLENDKIMAEIIYIGGGNAVALFRDRELYRSVGEKLGIKTVMSCQGLTLACASIKTEMRDYEGDKKKLDQEMEKVKRGMVRQPLYSPFPVVEQDNLSYQPLTCVSGSEDKEALSRIQFQKREAYKQIDQYNKLYPKVADGSDYGYPEDMDQLCKEHGDNSMIAIVHIDGNGMGERVIRRMKGRTDYSEGVSAIRNVSEEIARLFEDTYGAMLQKMWDHKVFISQDNRNDKNDKKKMFALRPIILDGDDFTFLCRADLAIPAAVGFMMELMKKQRNAADKVTACAGMAFVHSHFPFQVAYSIAEESCSRAKAKWYAQKEEQKETPSSCYLDFQVLKESEAGFSKQNRKWQKRPYCVCLSENKPVQDSLGSLFDTLKKMEEWPSGRIHKIHRALLEGSNAMEALEKEFASRGYSISNLSAGKWQDSPLLDAMELQGLCRMDLMKGFLTEQWEG